MASTYAQQVGLVRWAPKGWEWPTNCRDCRNDEVVLWLLLHSTQGETHGADRHDCISRSSRPDSYYCYIDREGGRGSLWVTQGITGQGRAAFRQFFLFCFSGGLSYFCPFRKSLEMFRSFSCVFLINLGALNGSRGLKKFKSFIHLNNNNWFFLWKQKFRWNLFNRV